MTPDTTLAAEFVDGRNGALLTVMWAPPATAAGTLLVLAPFAEEMNKCRRIVADLGRALAAAGWACAQFDYTGTGDSGGEFSDARTSAWQEDVHDITGWLESRGYPVTAVLGIRGGALLLNQNVLPDARRLLWQPVRSGKQWLQQLLRTRVAADALAGGQKTSVGDLRKIIAETPLEVGGYELAEPFCSDLETLKLDTLLQADTPTHVIEIGSEQNAKWLTDACAGAANLSIATVPGAAFWLATEIVTNQALVERSVGYLTS